MFWPLIRLVPRHTKVNFVSAAPVAAVLSLLLVIGSGVSIAMQGMNFGVDFAGGTVMEVTTQGPAPLGKLRGALDQFGAHDAQVQGFGTPQTAMVRFRSVGALSADAGASYVSGKLLQAFPGIKVSGQYTVGPKVSSELLLSGAGALGLAMALMLIYIWFRFQLQFGLGAILALFHDIALTIGLLSVTQIEVSETSIAALLTVIGYSMNEKVISFDRLRENLRKFKTTPLRDVINLSENERLSRTLITGASALLALSGALFMGGPALFPLVFTMAFGILIGTYSSIYVALPVILLWGVRRDDEEATPLPVRAPRR
ncbi:MAG: protein translocase subunit SecF [Caulobacterales bacterium]